jgi:hypothetical protein
MGPRLSLWISWDINPVSASAAGRISRPPGTFAAHNVYNSRDRAVGMGAMEFEIYRIKAEHCLALARQMQEPTARAALLDIAAFLKDWADRLKSNEPLLEQVTSEESPPLMPAD